SSASQQLAEIGGAAQRSADPAIVASGRQIADSASSLRLQTLKASANLMVSAAFPGFGPRPLESLLDQYDCSIQLMQTYNGLRRARSRRRSSAPQPVHSQRLTGRATPWRVADSDSRYKENHGRVHPRLTYNWVRS